MDGYYCPLVQHSISKYCCTMNETSLLNYVELPHIRLFTIRMVILGVSLVLDSSPVLFVRLEINRLQTSFDSIPCFTRLQYRSTRLQVEFDSKFPLCTILLFDYEIIIRLFFYSIRFDSNIPSTPTFLSTRNFIRLQKIVVSYPLLFDYWYGMVL